MRIPYAPKTAPAVAIVDSTRSGGFEPGPQGRLARDFHSVTLEFAATGRRTVDHVAVPEMFHHRVAGDPEAALPFLAAKLTASAAIDTDALIAQAAELDQGMTQLPPLLRVGRRGFSEDAERLVAEVEADRRTAAALHEHVPQIAGLDLPRAIAVVYGPDEAAAWDLLEQVRFDIVETKSADGYGDSSEARVTARRHGRTATFRIRGGVMTPGIYQAGHTLHSDVTSEDFGAAAVLFDRDELAVLAAFDWPTAR